MDRLVELYRNKYGCDPSLVKELTADGSPRRYYRMTGEADVIGTVGTSIRENEAFIAWGMHFSSLHLPVPEILAVTSDSMAYLQQDLGDTSLYTLISEQGGDVAYRDVIRHTIDVLPAFHYGVDGFDWNKCYPRAAMDHRAVLWDLNYFKYCFLKASGIEFDEDKLESDFECLASILTDNPENTLMLRDFQSRNVMVDRSGTPYVIDFQGARRGSGLYDVASFLWQARAGFDDDLRLEMMDLYRRSAERISGKMIDRFESRVRLMALFRMLQVLGAYGFRGFVERKSMFLASIRQAVANLATLLDVIDSHAPYLRQVLAQLVALPRFAMEDPHEGLTVTVMSFSYKKGIPDDMSGNGGGFVFDCRAVHNPGRYEEYKSLTGMDAPVIDFLETDGEMVRFMDECYGLVDSSVSRYIERGFTNLMVCFGCTGGQHRSVYGAEHMARHLKEKYGVRVRLIHRERNVDKTFNAL